MTSEPWYVAILKRVWQYILDAIRQQGRVEVEQAQKERGDALKADYDEIAGDDRSLDDALGGLRARSRAKAGHSDGGSLPDA